MLTIYFDQTGITTYGTLLYNSRLSYYNKKIHGNIFNTNSPKSRNSITLTTTIMNNEKRKQLTHVHCIMQ